MEKKPEKYEDTKSNLAIIFEKGVRPMTEKLKLGLKLVPWCRNNLSLSRYWRGCHSYNDDEVTILK